MKITLIASVPHTGTWTTVEWLKPYHDNFCELQMLRKQEQPFRDEISGQAGLVPNARNLVHGHVFEPFLPYIRAIAQAYPLIVPLRDPLAAMISARQRNNNVHRLVASFLDLATKIDLHSETFRPVYIPWDLGMDAARKAVRVGLGFRMGEVEIQNTRGDYQAKTDYLAGDVAACQAFLGQPAWALLTDARHILKPMLEHQGYRDLLWW